MTWLQSLPEFGEEKDLNLPKIIHWGTVSMLDLRVILLMMSEAEFLWNRDF